MGNLGALKPETSGQCFLVALVKRAQQDRSIPASPENEFLSIKDTAGVPTMQVGVECSHSSPPGLPQQLEHSLTHPVCFLFRVVIVQLHIEWYTRLFFFSHLSERFVFCSFSANIDSVKVSCLCFLKCHAVFFWGSCFCCCVPQRPVTSVGRYRKSGGRNGRF